MDFILEFAKLLKKNPKHTLPMQENVNCPYNLFLYRSKDCYLCFASSYLESCFFIDTASYDKDCMDGDYVNNCELCYECLHCAHCYNCDFCQDCKSCTDCIFCFECQSSTNCFGCVGLKRKEFHIFNKPYSKEEYFKKLPELKKMPEAEVRAEMEKLRLQFPHPPMHQTGSENVTGDYIWSSKNCFMCFHTEAAQDSAYLYEEIVRLKDCVDCTHIQDCELCYNLMSASGCYNVDCSWWVTDSSDCMYSFCLQTCKNCFGCTYLAHKEYYILNEPYSKEEYFKKVAEIKEELGQKGLHGKFLIADAMEMAKTL